MLTVAYLANEFPSPVEPYVGDEIEELRRRGVEVIAGSIRTTKKCSDDEILPDIVLLPVSPAVLLRGIWLCLRRWERICPLVWRVVWGRNERILQRAKALAHTILGASYAAELREFDVAHIHVHHGYVGSWIAMTASRLLGVGFSLTLHGSDLLLNGPFLDLKLRYCSFCVTVSNYNRDYILRHFPATLAEKVLVSRLGVEMNEGTEAPFGRRNRNSEFTILSVGRLHPVKDHAFLIEACSYLRGQGMDFRCFVAGDGPERRRLEKLIIKYSLQEHFFLLGHVSRDTMQRWYDDADVVVLTSRSEGIPLVLMEAMARGKIVLAPAITGIPELVTPGRTGLLYQPKSMPDFVAQLKWLYEITEIERGNGQIAFSTNHGRCQTPLGRIRLSARAQVQQKFNRRNNLAGFADQFLQRVASPGEDVSDESPVLQQI